MRFRKDSSTGFGRTIQPLSGIEKNRTVVRFLGQKALCILVATVTFAAGMAVVASPVGADHVEGSNARIVKRDTDVLRQQNGTWYQGAGGSTNGFRYTYDGDAYAYWHFGDMRGTYRAETYHPHRDATQPGHCGFFDRKCIRRPPTASPRYKIWQRDAQGEWTVARDWKSSIRDADGEFKEGWWGINNVHLDGYIVVEVRKRYSDDNRSRLAADAFQFEWQHLLPSDREIAIALCKASRLNEVIQSKQIISIFDFAEAINKAILAISVSYLVGVGLANLPTALVSALNGVHAIKNAAQLAEVAKNITVAIKAFQDTPRYLTLLREGTDVAQHVLNLTDDLVEAGTLGEHSSLYSKYQGWCQHPDGTVTDWDTGDYDPIFGKGIGGGCPWAQRWICVPGYTEYMIDGHLS